MLTFKTMGWWHGFLFYSLTCKKATTCTELKVNSKMCRVGKTSIQVERCQETDPLELVKYFNTEKK